jgi:Protein of unknown function (DUF2281)
MSVSELIAQKVSSLSDEKQTEVLDFVEFLLQKTELEPEQDTKMWNHFSLNQAMQGLEDDDLSDYSLSDIKERWQ